MLGRRISRRANRPVARFLKRVFKLKFTPESSVVEPALLAPTNLVGVAA